MKTLAGPDWAAHSLTPNPLLFLPRAAAAEAEKRGDDEFPRQTAYNVEHGITPTTVKKNVEDILAGLYKGDVDMNRVTAKVERQGSNMKAVLDGLRTDMRKAAENLEFETAARQIGRAHV